MAPLLSCLGIAVVHVLCSWASSIFDLKNSSPDALLPSVLERAAAEDMDRRNTEARLQGRHSDLLGLYPPPDEVCVKLYPINAGLHFVLGQNQKKLVIFLLNTILGL